MTLDEIRDEIWTAMGRPSNYDPDSDTSYDSGPYLTFIANEGQRQIASWKDPQTNRITRFRELVSEMFFQSSYTTGSLTDAGTTTTVVLPSGTGTSNDQYNGWVVDVSGEVRVIMDYVGSTLTATVHEAFSSAPESGDTYKLYKRFWHFLPSTHAWASEHITLPSSGSRSIPEGNLLEPLKIEDLEESRVLRRATREDSFPDFTNDSGDPTMWTMIGKKLVVDRNVDASKWFRLEYYRMPQDMTNAAATTDEPELPPQFHYAIVLWGIWWGYRQTMESGAAYAAKRDLIDYMRSSVHNYELQSERENSGLRMKTW